MQPPQVVYTPRHLILAELSAQTVLAHKYSSVTHENGFVQACAMIDFPQIPGKPQEKTRAFYGEPQGDLDGAIESAAELALRHLGDEYGFVILDSNYGTVVEKRENLRVALDRKREMYVKVEASLKEAEASLPLASSLIEAYLHYKQQLHRLVQRMIDICIEFADLLPVRAGGPYGIEYVGPPSPPAGGCGYVKLAFDVVQIIQSAYVRLLEYD